MKHKAISKMNPAQIVDISWSTFIGIVQLEESKLRLTKKDHLDSTLRATFSILANLPMGPKSTSDHSGLLRNKNVINSNSILY